MIRRPAVESMAGVAFKTRRIERHAQQMRKQSQTVARRVRADEAWCSKRWRTSHKASPGEIGYKHGKAGVQHTHLDFGDDPQSWLDYWDGWREGKERQNA